MMSDKRRVFRTIIGLGVVALFGIVYLTVISVYQAETEERMTMFSTAARAAPNHLVVNIGLTGIDPAKGDLTARLQFEPTGDLTQEGLLARPVILELNSVAGRAEYLFKTHERTSPIEVALGLDGSVSNYPFDTYESRLVLVAHSPAPTAQSDEPALAEQTDVPVALNYTGAMVGYNIAVTEPTDGNLAQIDLKISRSPTAIAFVCFVTSMMWLLALGAIAVAFSVAVRGRKVEIGMFSWLAALLFALVPLRNAMPGSPPIGVLSDFAAFFWAEELVALSLVTVVFTWLRRPGVKA